MDDGRQVYIYKDKYSSSIKKIKKKRINRIKNIFEVDVLYTRPGPFMGAKVLKTRDGIMALLIYIFTAGILYTFISLGFFEGLTYDKIFLLIVMIYLLISPIGTSFAYASPLKKALSLGIRKYFHYLIYTIIVIFLIIIFILITIFLTVVGLYVGFGIGLVLMFYAFYRIFPTPGIIALTHLSPLNALAQSFELTRKWEGIGFFTVYFILSSIIVEINKRLLIMFLEGTPLAIIPLIIFDIPLFIMCVSITLFAASFRKYLPKDVLEEREEMGVSVQ